jgi:hypothetical protein
MKAKLKTEDDLEDRLNDLDPPYESEEELKIGHMLDKYGIPFFYKQATIIYNDSKNEIWHPTFTLPQYGCAVIDYIPDNNPQQLESRINIYRYNQIPATVLGPKDLDKPNFQQKLYKKLQQESGHLVDLLLYKVS